MVHRVGRTAIRDLQTLFDLGTTRGLGDQRLLELFLERRDASGEAAFGVLVERHGPMVLRVCTNVLGDPADAADAFQATFLVLVRKRGSVGRLESLAGWLHGVACRVAARTRVERARRRAREERSALRVHEAVAESAAAPERAELGLAVQREVARLPEKYRSVVVLCYWEGLTHEQAAHRLDCPIGTVRSRMARAREMLRTRLVKRGLAPLAAALAALGESGARAAFLGSVPAGLVRVTVAAASQALSGHAAGGLAAAVAASVVWSMNMSKIVKVLVACSFLSAGVVGASLWARQAVQTPPAKHARPPLKQTKNARKPTFRPALVVQPPDLLLVEVLEALAGRPISGERLVRPDGSVSLGFYGDVQVSGLTLVEIKKKIIEHLRKFLSDESLGIVELDPNTGEPVKVRGPDGKLIDKPIAPEESATVFVDVTAYNSARFYVEGEVLLPGRLPYTGSDAVLDAIHQSGDPLSTADRAAIRLVRQYPPDSEIQVLPINYDEITMGTDQTTNYHLLPGDRIVVPRSKSAAKIEADSKAGRSPGSVDEASRRMEVRLKQLENKLEILINRIDTRSLYFDRRIQELEGRPAPSETPKKAAE